MSSKIYLINEQEQLHALEEQPYTSEDLLQRLLEQYPELLAGDQMDEAAPLRWLLVSREVGIPGQQEGGERWSLDHLFLDQHGVPTLVEVKRSSDTRIRREVVGQMLDYAANAVVYWPVESLRLRVEALYAEASQVITNLLGVSPDDTNAVESYWTQVETNLRAGRVRLIFVADLIPTELRRIVEFLNTQMDPAEVLAVELRQYIGRGIRTLVPQVIGQTMRAKPKTTSSALSKRKWTEESFFAELAQQHPTVLPIAREILIWARPRATRIWWGEGATQGSSVPVVNQRGRDHQLFALWTTGTIEFYFYWYQYKPPFDSVELQHELLQRLNTIPGIDFGEQVLNKRPTVPLQLFSQPRALETLLATFDWFIDQIKAAQS